MKTNKIGAAVVMGGLTAATLDFLAAMGIYHLSAQTVGKSIARGWFGKSAMQGGWDVAVIGIASHYAILLGAAAIYVLAAAAEPALRRRAWIAGPLFGAAIYVVMYFVVLPVSAAHGGSQPTGVRFAEVFLTHLFLVGLPIALWARRLLGKG